MKTIDFSYFIERFNAGEMDSAEKEWFLRELEGNENLRREVELRNKTDAILRETEVLNLRNKLAAIEKQREENVVRKGYGKSARLKYAALITLLITAGGIVLFSGKEITGDEILNKYYQAYETVSSSRSYSQSADPDYIMAMDYYKIHDYRKAALYFSKVLEKEPGDMESTLLQGVSHFEISDYPESKRLFSRVIDDKDNLFIEDARWYLALCYIKTGEETKSVDHLLKIRNSESIYRNPAKKILRKIK
jgi:tetratricopeptide (TPR) repeat protein